MANRNDDLYGAYLNAHIYSGGNCGDLSSGDPRPHRGTWVDFRGNDVKAAVALGQMHGRAGTEALSMERLVAMVDGMVAWDPTRGGVDLSVAKAAMKNVADAGKASSGMPVDADAVAKKIGVDVAAQPNAGDLADMKAATQGLGVVGETAVERAARLLYPWVVGSYSTGDDTTVLNQAIKVLHAARDRGEITGRQTIRVSVSKGDPWPTSPTAKSWEEVHGGIPWSPLHNDVAIVTGVSPDWICSLSEITEKSLMDDRRIATIARSETGKSEADDVIAAIHSMAQRDASALRLSLQIMPLNNTIKLREDIRGALGFAEPPLPEWVKPGAWAFFPKASPKGDYLQVVDAAHSNVLFRLPAGRTLLCPSGVLRIVARGIHELEWVVKRAKDENMPLDQMVFVVERELNETSAPVIVEVRPRDVREDGFPRL